MILLNLGKSRLCRDCLFWKKSSLSNLKKASRKRRVSLLTPKLTHLKVGGKFIMMKLKGRRSMRKKVRKILCSLILMSLNLNKGKVLHQFITSKARFSSVMKESMILGIQKVKMKPPGNFK